MNEYQEVVDAVTPYITVIPNRRPVVKVHPNLKQARMALSYRVNEYSNGFYRTPVDMWLYEWQYDGGWKELLFIPKGTYTMPWNQPHCPVS